MRIALLALALVSLAGCSGSSADDETDDPTTDVPTEETPTFTGQVHWDFGPTAGCAGDILIAAGANCVSFQNGPDAPAVDGHWIGPLDETYEGLSFSSTIESALGDSDCSLADADLQVIGEGNNGAAACTGKIAKGTVWVFLYPYAEPAQGMTFDIQPPA